MKNKLRVLSAASGALLLLGCVAATAGAGCARFWSTGELLSNLRFPLGLAAAGGAILSALGGRPFLASLGLLLAALLGWHTLLLWVPAEHLRAADGLQEELRVAHQNLLFGQVRPERIEAFADAFQPDVLGLVELLEENRSGIDWTAVLEGWRDRWPYQVHLPHDTSFGMALLSRYPLSNVDTELPPEARDPYSGRPCLVRADARVGDRDVRLVLVHPQRPGRLWRVHARAAVFDEVARELELGDGPAVVFGDFNCTEGSPLFRDLRQRCRLDDSRAGFGPCFSWQDERSLGRWVTLDHVLTRGLSVHRRGTGPDVGSDHLPAFAVLGVPR